LKLFLIYSAHLKL